MVRMFGHVWGIQIGEWRHPNPITNFNDFIANIKLSYQCLKRHVHLFGYPIIVFVTIFILYRTIIGLKKTSKKNVNLYTFLLILCIAISFYLQVIPMGLGVADRTTHTLWIALITVGLLAYYYSKHIAVLFFVLVSYSNFHLSYETVHYYSTVGNIWTKYIKQIRELYGEEHNEEDEDEDIDMNGGNNKKFFISILLLQEDEIRGIDLLKNFGKFLISN